MDKIVKGGYAATIEHDDFPSSPRECDNMSVMVMFHKKYDIGDKDHGYDMADYDSWDALKKAIIEKEKPLTVLPVYMFDHSGLTFSTDDASFRAQDPNRWDWGMVGFVFVRGDHPDLGQYDELPGKVEAAERMAKLELEEYDKWQRGDVWHVKIDRMDADGGEGGEEVDSCGGFIGYDYAVEEAGRMLDDAIAAEEDR